MTFIWTDWFLCPFMNRFLMFIKPIHPKFSWFSDNPNTWITLFVTSSYIHTWTADINIVHQPPHKCMQWNETRIHKVRWVLWFPAEPHNLLYSCFRNNSRNKEFLPKTQETEALFYISSCLWFLYHSLNILQWGKLHNGPSTCEQPRLL